MNVSSEFLIDATLAGQPVSQVCVLDGDAELPVAIAGSWPESSLRWIAIDSRQVAQLAGTIVHRVVVDNDAVESGVSASSIDLVLLPAPPDRVLSRYWLALAHHVLRPGGGLIVAGANVEGIRSVIADAVALFGPARAEDYRRKHRIAAFHRSEDSEDPGWLTQPGIAPGTRQELMVVAASRELDLVTLPGVFAGDRIDAGTSLLLAHLDVRSGSRVLDVGCGMGVIGIIAALSGAAQTELVDSNLLAVAAANENLRRLGIPNARAIASDVYEAVTGQQYDLIVSNPPFHRDKTIDLSIPNRLIQEAPRHLASSGSILVVANAFLAYGKWMGEVFRRVETVAATRQYHVIAASDPR